MVLTHKKLFSPYLLLKYQETNDFLKSFLRKLLEILEGKQHVVFRTREVSSSFLCEFFLYIFIYCFMWILSVILYDMWPSLQRSFHVFDSEPTGQVPGDTSGPQKINADPKQIYRCFFPYFCNFFNNVFRATRSKTTPLPAALNQARAYFCKYKALLMHNFPLELRFLT